jgi:hypothetical protein
MDAYGTHVFRRPDLPRRGARTIYESNPSGDDDDFWRLLQLLRHFFRTPHDDPTTSLACVAAPPTPAHTKGKEAARLRRRATDGRIHIAQHDRAPTRAYFTF